MRDPPQIVRLFESSFKRFLDKAEDLREDFRWRRERRGMSCLRLEIFLANKFLHNITFFFSHHLVTKNA